VSHQHEESFSYNLLSGSRILGQQNNPWLSY